MDKLSPSILPDDVDALKGIITDQSLNLERRDQELHAKSLLIEKLKHQLAVMRRGKFGTSSEGLEQLDLLIEELEIEQAEATAVVPLEDPPDPKQQPRRKPLPEHLPREEIVHSPDADCDHCGKAMRPLGEDVREVLDYIPGRFVVTRHVRPKLSCRDCGTISQAPMPSLPIERGSPGASLLAQVTINKYANHLPLYRQAQMFEREGMKIERSTMAAPAGAFFVYN